MAARSELWDKHVRQWQWLGSPLRPAPEDTRAAERCVREWHESMSQTAPRALLLGVTPEVARMQWPAGTSLLAVDQNPVMIARIWPGAALGHSGVCGDWRSLPVPDATQDVVIGDGCFTTLPYPAGYREVALELRRVLRARGRMVVRFSVQPDVKEPARAVFEDLALGRIGSFHAFKWRLAMALQRTAEEGVELDAVHAAWREAALDPEALARERGWPLPVVRTIDAYRGVHARHSFPTLAETRAVLAPSFEEVACHFPGYELGERWPTLALRPR